MHGSNHTEHYKK